MFLGRYHIQAVCEIWDVRFLEENLTFRPFVRCEMWNFWRKISHSGPGREKPSSTSRPGRECEIFFQKCHISHLTIGLRVWFPSKIVHALWKGILITQFLNPLIPHSKSIRKIFKDFSLLSNRFFTELCIISMRYFRCVTFDTQLILTQ